MKNVSIIFLAIILSAGFVQAQRVDSVSKNLNSVHLDPEKFDPCVKVKMGRTYCEIIGETYHRYVIAKGWYSLDPTSGCINSLYDKIPFKDIPGAGDNYFVKYKRGRLYNGKIRDTYVDEVYGKGDKYTLIARCKKGLLHGKVTTTLNGNIILEGQLRDGKRIGLWKYYNEDTLIITHYFDEIDASLTNITRYRRDTTKLEYVKNYKNGQPYTQITFHASGDTLSTLRLIDSTQMIYEYMEFYSNGAISKKGKKQLKDPRLKLKNVGYFKFNDIGLWEYFDEKNNLIRKETK